MAFVWSVSTSSLTAAGTVVTYFLPLLSTWSRHLSKAPWSFVGKQCQKPRSGPQECSLLLAAISLSLSRADRAKKYMFVHQPMYLCTHIATNISVCDHLYLYWVKCDFVSILQLHSITSRIFPASFLVYLWILTPTVTNLAPSICHPLTNLPKRSAAQIGGSECQPSSLGDSIS